MPKKIASKKIASPKSLTESEQTQKILLDNFVSLQKVMTNLAIKFDNLSNQISQLLNLFEISAKALAEKEFEMNKPNKDEKKIMDKLSELSEQNKIIARGVSLMHDRLDEGGEMEDSQMPQQMPMPVKPLKPQIPTSTPPPVSVDKYYKSIADVNREKITSGV